MVSGTYLVSKLGYKTPNKQMEEEEFYQIELPIQAVRVIHTGLSQAVDKWSGGDPQEQEDLLAKEQTQSDAAGERDAPHPRKRLVPPT